MPKTILLAGAPSCLRWQEKDFTVNTLLPAFLSHITQDPDGESYGNHDQRLSRSLEASPPSTTALPAWRSIPAQPTHLATGWSQLHKPASFLLPTQDEGYEDRPEEDCTNSNMSFLTASTSMSTTSPRSQDIELTQFLEASIALHEDPSTSLAPSLAQPLPPQHKLPAQTPTKTQLPPLPNLTPLSRLPTPAALERMHPQTPTVDLIVGIITASQPRTVTIRRSGREVELIELLVGDETRAGFGITFWLGQPAAADPRSRGKGGRGRDGKGGEGLREKVLSLRTGDVVAMRNVALRGFRGVVCGTSLALRRGGGTVLVHIPVEDGFEGQEGVPRVVSEKVGRVREWTARFVGGGQGVPKAKAEKGQGGVDRSGGGGTGLKRSFGSFVGGDGLPPDETQ